jgi:phospholipase C
MIKRSWLNVASLMILGAACGGGSNGTDGANGASGEAGAPGTPGAAGTAGTTGAAGEAGAPGAQGQAGEAGAMGAQGATGDAGAPGPAGEGGPAGPPFFPDQAAQYATATPIKHVIVVFGENVSFDHYFGTYPNAQNNTGETPFTAATGTPAANTVQAPLNVNSSFAAIASPTLLTANPNTVTVDGGTTTVNPFRLAAMQAETSDQGHGYAAEQKAYDNGMMDLFPTDTGSAESAALNTGTSAPAVALTKGAVMAYFDGNTLGTWWNLAQNYALNDNSYTTQFGPSSPGAINLISGQTNGVVLPAAESAPSSVVADGNGGLTLIGDSDPTGDTCSSTTTVSLSSKNIGDLLNAKGITWGWFQGGFDLTVTNANGTTGCARSTPQTATDSTTSGDYVQHHEPFQYYASTANPAHIRPASVETIGYSTLEDGTALADHHQYDTHDFFDALDVGNLAAVSYLKAPSFEDGHPGNSNPLDEQNFVKRVVAAVQNSPFWASTAIIFAYDDSDGWYDHQAPPIVNQSTTADDFLTGTGTCAGVGFQQGLTTTATPLLGVPPGDGGAAAPVQGRCGYGTRIPLLVVSPYAKKNFIDHTLTDQSSVLKFIEDNWLGGERIETGGSFDTIAGSINNMFTF